MQRLMLWTLLLATFGLSARAQTPPPVSPDPFEERVRALVAAPTVTIVHFWAPWCPNCRAEMGPEGWAKFLAANPEVQVVFVNFWHRGQDGAPALAQGGLGGQSNFLALTHPNPASKGTERTNTFLGLPVTWLPTTWVFRDGRMRYALNYGEVRFDVLQTLVNDARDAWKH